MLCETCRRTIQTAFDQLEKDSKWALQSPTSTELDKDPRWKPHHVSWETFHDSVAQGCMICTAMANEERQTIDSIASSLLNSIAQDALQLISQLVVIQHERPAGVVFQVSAKFHESQAITSQAAFEFRLLYSSALDHIQPIPELDSEMTKDDSLKLVATWFETCRTTHTVCNAERGNHFIPSRLLDLTNWDSGQIRLLYPQIEDMNGSYITLSHRWGPGEKLQLTDDTEEWLRSGFDTSRLPRTFKDAAEVVRSLGTLYIWIDSLCIKQDSKEDWERESSEMGDIYRYALCNVGATGTPGEHEGLQYRVQPARQVVDKLRITIESQLESLYIMPSHFWQDEIDGQLLNKRAWVLQERQLAPSMVHFADGQIFWECYELNACQSFPQGIPTYFFPLTLRRKDLCSDRTAQHFIRFGEDYDADDPRIAVLEEWISLSADYMLCNITRLEDKLPALSGLAKKFQMSLKSKYLAGLWEYHLAPQLLWMRGYGEAGECVSEYRAPSWSWASIQGQIITATSNHLGDELIEVVETSMTSSGQDPTGAVSAGFVKVRASLHLVLISESSTSSYHYDLKDQAGNFVEVSTRFDDDPLYTNSDRAVFCMPVQSWYYQPSPDPGRPNLFGLILGIAKGHSDCFKRLGLFWEYEELHLPPAFNTNSSRQVITIV